MAETGFTRPSLPELIDRIGADLLAQLAADEVLRRSDLAVQARVQAAALHAVYGFIAYLARQVLPDTAETGHLDRHAAWWAVTRKPAIKAAGEVTFTTQAGVTVPAGTLLQRPGGGDYVTTAEAVAGGPTVTLPVAAAAAGAAGNAAAGAKLVLVSPIAGVASQGTAGELAGGADAESDDDLRVRLRTRVQQPPHGGAAFDYVAWALAVPGVTRAWAYPLRAGPGTVGVTMIMGDRPDMIPTPADVALVQAAIDAVRPATADAIVFAPTPVAVDVTLSVVPDTPEVRAAIASELADFFRREALPDGTIHVSRLREAISAAASESHHQLAAPAADVVLGAGELAVLGLVTWA